MTEQKKSRGVKVYLKNNIWVEENGVTQKKLKGQVVILSADQVKHYGKAVTKDLPEGEDE